MNKTVKIIIEIVLLAVIAFLTYTIYASIMEPVNFDKQTAYRKSVAVQRLKDIRTLQVAYKSVNGKFVSTVDSLKDFCIDSLKYIPFSSKEPVQMEATVKMVSGVPVPLFEARMPYKSLLKGLDNQLRINLDDECRTQNRYEGLQVGSISAPNNNAGNWE